MYKIGIDTLGGDNGSLPVVRAVINYINDNIDKDIMFYLYGDEKSFENELKSLNENAKSKIKIIQTNDFIDLNKNVLTEFRRKTTSIALALKDMNDSNIDAFISQGSSAALRICANFAGRINGVKECPFVAIIPTLKGSCLLLDAGANIDVSAEDIASFAKIGSIYVKEMYNKDNPIIGLLNNGVEAEKGNAQTRKAHEILSNDKSINFYGNVEFRDFIKGYADILVCDGFIGNCLLKTYEGTAKNLIKLLKDAFNKNIFTKLGALLIKNTLKKNFSQFEISLYGGAPILGCKKIIVKCHGNANEKEIYSAIEQTYVYLIKDITNKLIAAYS